MIGPKLVRSFVVSLSLLAGMLLAGGPRAHAQAYITASKKADLTVFGLYTNSKPDYGQSLAAE